MEDRGEVRTPVEEGDEITGTEKTIDPVLSGIERAIDKAQGLVDDSMKRRAEQDNAGE